MANVETQDQKPVAYTIPEFSALFGKKKWWAYKMAKANRIRSITGYGQIMIPASEVERILSGEESK